MPNRGGFSWKRATGISAAKARISRRTGVPLTKSGRQRKLGRLVSGGGCALTLTLALLLLILAGVSYSSSSAPALVATAITPAPTVTPTPNLTPNAAAHSAGELRAGPGVNYPLAGSVKRGEPLIIIARNPTGAWLQLASGAWIIATLIDRPPAVPIVTLTPTPTGAPIPTQPACCKHCGRNSQPCGDTCISLKYTCHKPGGCACP